MGLGFVALVIGNVVSASLSMRLAVRLAGVDAPAVLWVLDLALKMLWAVLALPLLAYGAARILELKPWPTAIGAATTGTIFVAAIHAVSGGLDVFKDNAGAMLSQLGCVVVGVFLTAYAVKAARTAVDQKQQEVATEAEKKKSEYDEFAKEAERLAAKSEAKEANSTATASDASAEPSPAPTAPVPPTSENNNAPEGEKPPGAS